ncbi:NAPDH-dependent diflavin reductase [Coemansia sp. RSA 552]|nr:NAPDH-dependent diflavin reductase [Coemansia sp. RSA 552]
MADTERKLLVLYGSQTGYAKDTAQRIARQGWRRHFAVRVEAMDAQTDRRAIFDAQYPVVFVCSTTGQGEEPDNMKRFWRFLLRKALPHNALEQLQFAVFGLGDSSYQKFNFPAKRLFRRLQQLGAQAIVERGDGDDQHYLGMDGALDPWLDELWQELLRRYPLPRPVIPDEVAPDPSFDVAFATEGEWDHAHVNQVEAAPDMFPARLVSSERLTAADHFQDVRHLRFGLAEVPEERPVWNPGDCAVVRPENPEADVSAALERMGWTEQADTPLRIVPHSQTVAELPERVPRVTTLRWLFAHYFDIGAVPRRSFFEMLYYFSQSTNEKERLGEFSQGGDGQDELQTYCMRPRRTILEVLDDLPNSRVPLTYIFDVFPEIAERSFSISSAAPADHVDLTVAIVDYQTIMQKPRVGVCTRWLAAMTPGELVHLRFARGTMHLPTDPAVPIMMVGPGTGIAAFMAFLECRIANGATENYLFFGCRSQEKDFLYRQRLEQWAAEGKLHLFCAFSRDQDTKVYVQQRIREQGQLVWQLLEDRGAAVYVSGNANRMPDDVRQAFTDVVAARMGSEEGASAYIRALAKSRRYQEECWY